MPGYFKTYRKIFSSDIWHKPVEFRLFFYLIGQARFEKEPTKKYGVEIKRGQYLRSYRNLQKDLEYLENNAIKQYSLSTIKRTIEKLEKDGRIKTEQTRLGTLFTVINYLKYQRKESLNNECLEQEQNTDGTGTEHLRNNTNNGNKVKKEKNNIVPSLETDKIYDSLSEYWTDIFKTYIEIYRSKNTTGKITDNRHYKLLKELNEIYQEMKFKYDSNTYQLTEDIFEYGINQVVEKNIDNLNYAKKCWIGQIERKEQDNDNDEVSKIARKKEARDNSSGEKRKIPDYDQNVVWG
ncbi:hypothetical protein [Natronospora cellulosivora (SeqCode)]